VTKHRCRDKESVAKSHRNQIAATKIAATKIVGTKVVGTRSSDAHAKRARTLLPAAFVVNLARLRLRRQKPPAFLDSDSVFVVIRRGYLAGLSGLVVPGRFIWLASGSGF